MCRFLYIACFILSINLAFGSTGKTVPKKVKLVVHMDSSAVSVRHMDTVALKAYSKQPEFQYKETITGPSLWTRFWRWFWHWVEHLFTFGHGKDAKVNTLWFYVFKYLFIALGIAALAFLVFKLAGVDMLNIFRKKSAAAAIPYSEFFEDINTINFDSEIENAVSKSNYRFAVRLLYLKCLKQLSDAGQIDWQIDKTNSTYIAELASEEQRRAFRSLTRQFEYVWYGEFSIDGPVYHNINSSFRDFNTQVA